MANHTPGPWELEDNHDGGFDLIASNKNWIATIHYGREEDEHDARLIAAAPELLEALIQARAAMPDKSFATDEAKAVIDLVNAAIDRAEGNND